MRTIIAGSRTFNDQTLFNKVMAEYPHPITEIVSGGAEGADRMGEDYARQNNIKLTVFKADWTKHGRAAGPTRNKLMAGYGEALIVFWDGESRGTASMIGEANKRGLPVYVSKIG